MLADLPNHSTYQLSEIVLTLRDDLAVTPRLVDGETVWMIEDERAGRYYRVGRREYTFLALCDGRRTIGSALGRAATLLGEAALSQEEGAALCRWLIDSGLATTAQSCATGRIRENQSVREANSILAPLKNPLSQKIPLLRPDRFLAPLTAALGWVFSAPVGIVWIATVIAGWIAVAASWGEFSHAVPNIVARENWLVLAAISLGLKLVHEAAHGIACQRFGGTVREAGITLVLFVPLPYVDVTSSWRFGSRWHRVTVAAAGMLVETFAGAVAAIAWSLSDPGLTQQYLQSVVLAAAVMTVLVNANPLMRFDGYYILSDLLEMPNLAAHGQQAWRQLGRRWWLGLRGELPSWPEGRTWLVLTYGLAALLWRIVVCVGLIVAADGVLLGAGVVLAAAAVLAWAIVPLARLLWFVARGTTIEQPSRVRFLGLSAVLGAGVWFAGTNIHWSERISAPVVVAYYPPTDVRAVSAGFIERVAIHDRSRVAAGEVLFELRNPELTAQVADVTQRIEQSCLRSAQLLERRELTAWEAEQELEASLRLRLGQLREYQAALVIRAPRGGIVLGGEPETLTGRYVQAGESLVAIGDAADLRILALVEPAARGRMERESGATVRVYLEGRDSEPVQARISDIAARAERRLPHPALGAHTGGALAVRARAAHEAKSASDDGYELVEPRLLVQLELADSQAARVWAGESGTLRMAGEPRLIVDLARRELTDWWHKREAALRDQWYR